MKVKKDVHKYITIEPPIVNENATLLEVVEVLLKDPRSRSVYVTDDKGILRGIIPTSTILKATHILKGTKTLRKEDTFEVLKISTVRYAKDIMHLPLYISYNDEVADALEKMVIEGYQELPVVDERKKVIGDLNCLEIIKAMWEK